MSTHADTGSANPDAGTALADAAEREAILTCLDETLFVEAAAGTGKTTALVGRIVEILRSGRAALDAIVGVTFTEKAAGEMKLRLRAEIEIARRGAPEGSDAACHLERALAQLELAHIGTIHGFCADLLKERPVEAGIDPAFQVAAEEEAGRLFRRAFESWFQEALADPPPGLRRALRRDYGRDSGGPAAALRQAAQRLADHRDFEAPWKRPEAFDREAALDRAVDRVRELAALAPRAAKPTDWLTRHFESLERWIHELDTRERVHGRDYDGLEARLRALLRSRDVGWHRTGFRDRLYGEDLLKAEVVARRDGVKRELDEILALADADLAARLREELRPVVDAYEELKRREGRLDFLDLLLRTRDLLRNRPDVLDRYRRRFARFFVDEFQDTDPLQVEILLLLCSDGTDPRADGSDPCAPDPDSLVPEAGKLFVVGDPKQSIYRFRRADVALYERTRDRLARAGARVLRLTTSFRAQPRIQQAVNGAFVRRMTGSADGTQASYVPLTRFRADLEDQPALVALPVPAPYGKYGTVYKRAVEDSLPDAVGAFVQWLLEESGWRVTERERPGKAVPIEARHICLLFRRFQSWGDDATRPYVMALEARGLPHVLVGGRSYFDREEVLAVRNALTAIEWPGDRLSVYAVLRGPLFSLGDATLLAFSDGVGPLHPLRPFGDHASAAALEEAGVPAELRAVSEALEILGSLHRERNGRPIAATLRRLLAAVRAHAGIAIWPAGEQALANVLRVLDRARAYERGGAPSFRGFLERLDEEAKAGQAEEAPIVEEGTEGVRMMTVHKAKGLEFPVVILADMTCNATFDPPSRYVDLERRLWAEPLCGAAPADLLDHLDLERARERAESDRVAYVAATRARDLLVVPALGDGRDGKGGFPDDEVEWWLDALNPALYPPSGSRRGGGPAGEAPGCPVFGSDSVLERPDREGGRRPTPSDSVAPGPHVAEAGNPVVWWDPSTLRLDVDAPTGRRQERLLAVERDPQPTLDVEEGIGAYEAWRSERRATLEAGSRPAFRLHTVRAVAGSEAPFPFERSDLPPVEWHDVNGSGDRSLRPGGDRFGSLVHATLATVELEASRPAVEEIVRLRGRSMAAAPAETDAAVDLVLRALAHPVLRRAAAVARGGGIVLREVPLHTVAPDGSILEGVADLAFRDPDGWMVVDYKTDRALEGSRSVYETQVALYAHLLAETTGEPARGAVLAL